MTPEDAAFVLLFQVIPCRETSRCEFAFWLLDVQPDDEAMDQGNLHFLCQACRICFVEAYGPAVRDPRRKSIGITAETQAENSLIQMLWTLLVVDPPRADS